MQLQFKSKIQNIHISSIINFRHYISNYANNYYHKYTNHFYLKHSKHTTSLYLHSQRTFTVTPLEKDGTLSLLQYGDKQIYLLGTAHISGKSAEQVRNVINEVKPDTVFVELCPERAAKIWQKIRENQNNPQSQTELVPITTEEWLDELPFAKQFKQWNVKILKFLESFGFVYGGEFYAALEEAEKIDAKIVYGDREVRETMQKLNDGLKSLWSDMSGNFSFKSLWGDFQETYKKHYGELNKNEPHSNTNIQQQEPSSKGDWYSKSDDGKKEFFGKRDDGGWGSGWFGDSSQQQTQQNDDGKQGMGFFDSWKQAMDQASKMREELNEKSESARKKMPQNQWKEVLGLFTNPEETIEAMKDREKIREKFSAMKEYAPDLVKGLVEERDEIMSNNLKKCDGKIIVAVVGIGHMDGMEEYFKNL